MCMHNSNAGELGERDLNNNVSFTPRILVVWSWLPCNHSGAGILMRRLFADYPSDRLWTLTSHQSIRDLASYQPIPPPERQVPVPEARIHRRWIDKLARFVNYLLIPCTVWRGVRLARQKAIEVIFTIPWDHFTIAAYFIHRITGLPMYMYFMDDPAGTRRTLGSQGIVYSIFMPRIVRAARRVWGVSSGMCEDLEQRYGVKCLPLLPVLDLDDFQKRSKREADLSSESFQIIFTGAIYSAQVDAVLRLVRVVNEESRLIDNPKPHMRLTLYTSAPAKALERLGLVGKNVRRDEVRHDEIAAVIARADVAFLPLSFEADMRHIVETSFPSKIAEYLAAGVPILVHAPSYSTVARYCRRYDCGLVVDQPNDESLRSALMRLATDVGLRRRLSAKALETASENHNASRIVPEFRRQLSEIES
jgi:glycosyltransferase involved in cell wall biosynthesis